MVTNHLINRLILVGAAGAFCSGFVYWMANSAHQRAEHFRRNGDYCQVEVVRKEATVGADGSVGDFYVYVKRVNQVNGSEPIQCDVHERTYAELHRGQRLMAWVLGTEAVLDRGPGNAASMARTMFKTCIGFALVMIAGVALTIARRIQGQ